ncbi:MAG: hypothetical protein HOV80_14030 [Polyangiaceae bacterium]|nr:hypothetical protein [Polyangiaceae bacterium]
MSKILPARELLDLVRQREEEERQETETVDSGRAGGRRIYLGNTAAMRALRARRQEARPAPQPAPQPARGRNNTQLIEQPAAARGARPPPPAPGPPPARPVTALQQPPARAQDRSRLPPAERGRDESLDPPTPILGAPALRPPEQPLPATGRGRRNTVQMPRQKSEAKPPAPPPPPDIEVEVEADAEEIGEGLPTLEIELPRSPSQPPSAAAAAAIAEARTDRKPEAKQPRKASSQGWVRSQGDPASQPPASPARAPSVVAKPARSSTPSPVPAVGAQAAQPAARSPSASPPPPAPEPPSDPNPASPAKTSVASMFSWVTQKPDWSPPSVPIKSVPPPPASSAPATVPMMEPMPESARSLVADEPIALSSEETLVLIHYDAAVSLQEMADRTGLSEWRVQKIVDHLRSRGVLEDSGESEAAPPSPPAKPALVPPVPPVAPVPPTPPVPPVAPMPPTPPVAPGPPPASPLAGLADAVAAPTSNRPALALDAEEEPPPRDRERTLLELELEAFISDDDSKLQRAKTEEVVTDTEETIVDNGSGMAASSDVARSAKRAENAERSQATADTAASTPEPEAEAEDQEPPEEDAAEERKYSAEGATVRTLLAHFENVLNKLPSDERAKIATNGSGDDLFALCFDKDPAVVRALWQNVNISNEHARFAAFHHRTSLGLEVIAQRTEFLKDPQIQRRFIRNPVVSEGLLRKMLLAKRLIDIYKVTIDRETTEKTRQSSRAFLRNKFATTDSEDRVELIWKTEGRALTALTGLSIDSKTAALICSRPLVSLMLVQSFCRFAATPPSVIHHFLKQQIVKRQVHLRNALLKHPNCPSDAKRAF